MTQYLKLRQKPLIYFSVAINWALAFAVFLCKNDIAALNTVCYHWEQTHLYMILLCLVTKSECSGQERMVGKYHDNFFVQVKQVYCYRLFAALRRLRVPPAAAPLILSFSSGFTWFNRTKRHKKDLFLPQQMTRSTVPQSVDI